MNDNAQCGGDDYVRTRQAPVLYVVDADANVLYASVAEEVCEGLAATLRAAIASLATRGPAQPIIAAGRLVRAQRLAAPAGHYCYAVFFEHVAVVADDTR